MISYNNQHFPDPMYKIHCSFVHRAQQSLCNAKTIELCIRNYGSKLESVERVATVDPRNRTTILWTGEKRG